MDAKTLTKEKAATDTMLFTWVNNFGSEKHIALVRENILVEVEKYYQEEGYSVNKISLDAVNAVQLNPLLMIEEPEDAKKLAKAMLKNTDWKPWAVDSIPAAIDLLRMLILVNKARDGLNWNVLVRKTEQLESDAIKASALAMGGAKDLELTTYTYLRLNGFDENGLFLSSCRAKTLTATYALSYVSYALKEFDFAIKINSLLSQQMGTKSTDKSIILISVAGDFDEASKKWSKIISTVCDMYGYNLQKTCLLWEDVSARRFKERQWLENKRTVSKFYRHQCLCCDIWIAVGVLALVSLLLSILSKF